MFVSTVNGLFVKLLLDFMMPGNITPGQLPGVVLVNVEFVVFSIPLLCDTMGSALMLTLGNNIHASTLQFDSFLLFFNPLFHIF